MDKTTATAEIGIVQNVRIIISHSELNAIAVERLEALAEDAVLDKTTAEVETKDIKAETDKVDALRETTVGKTTTATAEIGIVQNVRIIISHSELNATAVEKPVVLVEDAVLDKTTAEVEAKDTRAETVKVDALRETTEVKTTATAEIGIVQNVEIIISHSVLNVIHVDFQKAVAMTDVAETTDTVEMTDVAEMIAVEKQKYTPITIGIVQNVKIQTSHSAKNVIAAKHLDQAAGGGGRSQRRDDGGRPPRRDSGGRPPQRDDRRAPRRDDGGRPPQRDDRSRAPRRDDGGRPPQRDDGARPPRHEGGRPPRRDGRDRRGDGGGYQNSGSYDQGRAPERKSREPRNFRKSQGNGPGHAHNRPPKPLINPDRDD